MTRSSSIIVLAVLLATQVHVGANAQDQGEQESDGEVQNADEPQDAAGEQFEDPADDAVGVETGGDNIPDAYDIVDEDGAPEWDENDVVNAGNSETADDDFQDTLPVMVAAAPTPGPAPISIGMNLRVSKGFAVLENQAKFQAQISYTGDPATWGPARSNYLWERQHVCGGALIEKDWVLTAAHCVSAKHLGRGLTVTLGAEDISRPTDGMKFKVDRLVIHRRYSKYENDIALVHLAPDQRYRPPSEIGTIPLHTGAEPAAETPLSGTGWGRTQEAGPGIAPSAKLWRAEQLLIPVAKCRLREGFGVLNANGRSLARIGDRVLCAGDTISKTCSGDSGGPLVFRDGAQQLVGIVSWNKTDCNNPANPGVYTRVASFNGWIRKGMGTTAAGGNVQYLDD